MPTNKEFAKINKKLDLILKKITRNEGKYIDQIANLISNFMKYYSEKTLFDRQVQSGIEYNKELFDLIDFIVNNEPKLLSKLGQPIIDKIKFNKESFNKAFNKRNPPNK